MDDPTASDVPVSPEPAPAPGKRVVFDLDGDAWDEGEPGWFQRRGDDGDVLRLGILDDAYGVARVESAVDSPPGPVAEFLAWLIDLDDPAGVRARGIVSLDEIIRRARAVVSGVDEVALTEVVHRALCECGTDATECRRYELVTLHRVARRVAAAALRGGA